MLCVPVTTSEIAAAAVFEFAVEVLRGGVDVAVASLKQTVTEMKEVLHEVFFALAVVAVRSL